MVRSVYSLGFIKNLEVCIINLCFFCSEDATVSYGMGREWPLSLCWNHWHMIANDFLEELEAREELEEAEEPGDWY